MVSAGGSALKMPPQLTKHHAKPKQGRHCRKSPKLSD